MLKSLMNGLIGDSLLDKSYALSHTKFPAWAVARQQKGHELAFENGCANDQR